MDSGLHPSVLLMLPTRPSTTSDILEAIEDSVHSTAVNTQRRNEMMRLFLQEVIAEPNDPSIHNLYKIPGLHKNEYLHIHYI